MRRHVDHGFDLVFLEGFPQQIAIDQIAFDKHRFIGNALAMTFDQIVENDSFVPIAQTFFDYDASNVTRSASN
jgi:hypothetical protein